ncbi:MAG: hypothetical protein N3E52_06825 [Candidatus Bathyarchaeota archaeon]|nr:hypothetical protein [Candidatus Bathyarchaeota archaeon]
MAINAYLTSHIPSLDVGKAPKLESSCMSSLAQILETIPNLDD